MKSATIAAFLLAASQCGGAETKPKPVDSTPPKVEADAGSVAPDVGHADAERQVPSMDWMKAGPPPFQVPTVSLALPGLDAQLIAPLGTRAIEAGPDVEVKLGEGRNFWFVVSRGDVDLADARARVTGEGESPAVSADDHVIWADEGRWFFRYSGEVSCANPGAARHGRDDVDMMLASCRSISAPEP